MMKNFKNEISWDGILAIVAIIGITAGAVLYCAETNATARDAQKTAAAVAEQQSTSDKLLAAYEADADKHFAKIDNAITMIGTVLVERTGKSLPAEKFNMAPSTTLGPNFGMIPLPQPPSVALDPPDTNSTNTTSTNTDTTIKQK